MFIGRGSPFGNPFRIRDYGSRELVIEKFEHFLRSSPALISRLGELKGKYLGCFCVPEACHGAVILKVMEELS